MLFALRGPRARLWLADYKDCWLTIRTGGYATFHPDHALELVKLHKVDMHGALDLCKRFQREEFEGLTGNRSVP